MVLKSSQQTAIGSHLQLPHLAFISRNLGTFWQHTHTLACVEHGFPGVGQPEDKHDGAGTVVGLHGGDLNARLAIKIPPKKTQKKPP